MTALLSAHPIARENPMGRPPYEPTAQGRRQVEALAGYGVPHHMIARIIGVAELTLRKYYDDQLKDGEAKATAKVAQTLFQRATEGRELAACIFWLKARAGWREKQPVDPATMPTLEQLLSQSQQRITVVAGIPIATEAHAIDAATDAEARAQT
ncbi:MAG: hypothetical protein H0X38_08385 [Planctomycetes bacterium]|nr:hypothetical protein [Planctomycetota bacterium]